MYDNIVLPVQNLRKTTDIKPGGLCRIIFFKKDDVLSWPEKSPMDGVIYEPLQLKAGTIFYAFQPADKDRFFNEDLKRDAGGPFVEVLVNGRLGGNTLSYITCLDSMMHFDYGLIIQERNGERRLIGNADSGAEFSFSYTSGDADSSRINALKFNWKLSQRMPIYQSEVVMIDDQIIPITPQTIDMAGSALNEVIPITDLANYTIQWNTTRKEKFGNAAVINVYLVDEDGILRKSEVEIKPDAITNPTKYDLNFGGISTGVIIIS